MSERQVPYYCPYCGGEDLRPYEDRHGAWECRECVRVFALSFIGLLSRSIDVQPTGGSGGNPAA
jgi:hypothetical protein